MPERLTESLTRRGLLDAARAREAMQRQVLLGGALDTCLLELHLVDEPSLLEAMAAAYGLATAGPAEALGPVDTHAGRAFPEQWAKKHAIAPLALDLERGVLTVLSPAPADVNLLVRLGELLELTIKPLLAPEFRVHQRLALLYDEKPAERFRTLIDRIGGPGAPGPHARHGAPLILTRPLTFGEAITRLKEARDRDDIAHTALAYAKHELDFAAMFRVRDQKLEGWSAVGPGAENIGRVSLALSAGSAFRVVLDTQAHYLGPLPTDELHLGFLEQLRRPHPRAALIVPVRIRGRTIALMYGENGPRTIPPRLAADLMLFTTHVQSALEALVMRRKVETFSEMPVAAERGRSLGVTPAHAGGTTPPAESSGTGAPSGAAPRNATSPPGARGVPATGPRTRGASGVRSGAAAPATDAAASGSETAASRGEPGAGSGGPSRSEPGATDRRTPPASASGTASRSEPGAADRRTPPASASGEMSGRSDGPAASAARESTSSAPSGRPNPVSAPVPLPTPVLAGQAVVPTADLPSELTQATSKSDSGARRPASSRGRQYAYVRRPDSTTADLEAEREGAEEDESARDEAPTLVPEKVPASALLRGSLPGVVDSSAAPPLSAPSIPALAGGGPAAPPPSITPRTVPVLPAVGEHLGSEEVREFPLADPDALEALQAALSGISPATAAQLRKLSPDGAAALANVSTAAPPAESGIPPAITAPLAAPVPPARSAADTQPPARGPSGIPPAITAPLSAPALPARGAGDTQPPARAPSVPRRSAAPLPTPVLKTGGEAPTPRSISAIPAASAGPITPALPALAGGGAPLTRGAGITHAVTVTDATLPAREPPPAPGAGSTLAPGSSPGLAAGVLPGGTAGSSPGEAARPAGRAAEDPWRDLDDDEASIDLAPPAGVPIPAEQASAADEEEWSQVTIDDGASGGMYPAAERTLPEVINHPLEAPSGPTPDPGAEAAAGSITTPDAAPPSRSSPANESAPPAASGAAPRAESGAEAIARAFEMAVLAESTDGSALLEALGDTGTVDTPLEGSAPDLAAAALELERPALARLSARLEAATLSDGEGWESVHVETWDEWAQRTASAETRAEALRSKSGAPATSGPIPPATEQNAPAASSEPTEEPVPLTRTKSTVSLPARSGPEEPVPLVKTVSKPPAVLEGRAGSQPSAGPHHAGAARSTGQVEAAARPEPGAAAPAAERPGEASAGVSASSPGSVRSNGANAPGTPATGPAKPAPASGPSATPAPAPAGGNAASAGSHPLAGDAPKAAPGPRAPSATEDPAAAQIELRTAHERALSPSGRIVQVSPSAAPAPPAAPPSPDAVRTAQLDQEVEHLLDLLIGPDADARRTSGERLKVIGSYALPKLLERFPGRTSFDPFSSTAVLPPFVDCSALLGVLAHFGPEAHPLIAKRLDAPDPVQRFFATYFYGVVFVPEVIPRLMQRLHDEEPRVCMLAARTLFSYRDTAEFQAVLDHLHGRLDATSVAARRHAAHLLGVFRDVSAIPLLITIFERKEKALFDSAESALAEITKQRLGSNPKKWRAWWQKHEGRSRIGWLVDGLSSKEAVLRRSSAEELRAITGVDLGYDDNAPRREREDARLRWVKWWEQESARPATGGGSQSPRPTTASRTRPTGDR